MLTAPLLAQTYTPPRTPWGDPDLQGIWPSTEMVNVPLERPEKFGTLTSDRAELVERFTRTAADTIQYDVTVTEPATWTAPIRISFPRRRDPDYQLLEYACHEGNYSMRNTLSGSRGEERAK